MRTILGGTHIGMVRKVNQDRYRVKQINETLSVAVLCDGMGGTNGGGTAAQIAVDFAETIFDNTLTGPFLENLEETIIHRLFTTIFSGANQQVYEKAQENKDLTGMGSTMILAILADDTLYIGWVGDSRVYIAGPNESFQLTKDHTVVQHMVDEGEITKEEATTHPKKHFITRAVGVSETIDLDFDIHKLKEEEMVLLCSDGLYEYLDKTEIYSYVQDCIQKQSVDPLISLANSHGGSDNITAVIMK